MSSDLQLTPTQCKRARAVLKWNPQDLASQTHLTPRQIEKFERGEIKLQRPENEELVKLFLKHNIEFAKNGDVTLKAVKNSGQVEEKRFKITPDLEMNEASSENSAHHNESSFDLVRKKTSS